MSEENIYNPVVPYSLEKKAHIAEQIMGGFREVDTKPISYSAYTQGNSSTIYLMSWFRLEKK